MGEAQYVKFERIGKVMAAEILREKITEHENTPVFNELTSAAETCGHRLAVGLAQVGLLSSAGLGALISLHKQCAGKGGKLVIFGLQQQIFDLMKLTHLHKLLSIADSRDAAVAKAGA